jgi:thymidine kinase
MVICGPMFAGKTSHLLVEAEKTNAVLFKPSFDTRYSETDVVSHDGECAPAHAIRSFKDIASVGELERPYCFDEVQFLDGERYEGDFVADVRTLLAHGVDIIAAGLDMNWKGEPFPITATLLGMADEVVKIGSFCNVCSSLATKTSKKTGGNDVELGNENIYEPRCNRHWHAS